MKLHEVERDIRYLSKGVCSFGNKKGSFNEAKYTGIHEICGRKIEVYFYDPRIKGQQVTTTPYKQHSTITSKFEGEYHPWCKIDGYPEYTISENTIKYRGNEVYSLKNKTTVPPDLFPVMIVAGFYSLITRLRFYIERYLEKDRYIDPGHLEAPWCTYKDILAIKNTINWECVSNFLKDLPLIMEIFEQISMYYFEESQERKQWIIDTFEHKPYRSPPASPYGYSPFKCGGSPPGGGDVAKRLF